jgi:hypothetical protein
VGLRFCGERFGGQVVGANLCLREVSWQIAPREENPRADAYS